MRCRVIGRHGEVPKKWASFLPNRYVKIRTHTGSPLFERQDCHRQPCRWHTVQLRGGGPIHRESMVDLSVYYNFLAVKHLSLTKPVYSL